MSESLSGGADEGFRRRAVTLTAALAAFVLALIGAEWGRVESWNPDQMALQCLTCVEGAPFRPRGFLKPPFHAYANFLVAYAPAKAIGDVLSLAPHREDALILLLSRGFTAALFAGSAAIVHVTIRPFFGALAAGALALLYATSAGLVVFAHFLTADMPLVFWTLASFHFATRILSSPVMSNYLAAGALCGIATATKYNGLAAGVFLPVAHLLVTRPMSLRALILSGFDLRLVLGVLAVFAAFVAANPYAVLDFGAFWADFHYNYVTTPVYAGETSGTSFLPFMLALTEIFGWPLFLAIVTLVLVALQRRKEMAADQRSFLILSTAFFVVYALKFGSFPRLETRFVLPAAPFFLFLAAPGLSVLSRSAVFAVTTPIVLYGALCSVVVGQRFLDDPRMHAQSWVAASIGSGATIESSYYAPRFAKLGVDVREIRTPMVSGRRRGLEDVATELGVLDQLVAHEGEEPVDWFGATALALRAPDYIAIDSLYFDRFLTSGAALYPSVAKYYDALIDERLEYRIVFDRSTPDAAWWVYPRHIDFLRNRMIVLERSAPR